MKLGELKSAIRTRKGNPSISIKGPDGTSWPVVAQKSSILAVLDEMFDKKKSVETNAFLNDEGMIVFEFTEVFNFTKDVESTSEGDENILSDDDEDVIMSTTSPLSDLLG